MSYGVGTLWGIYIIVVIATFIILWIVFEYNSCRYSGGSSFFLSTLAGAIAVFVGAAWLDAGQLTDSDKTALSVLFIVSFLLPILVIFYIVWSGQYASLVCQEKCDVVAEKNCDNPCREND